MGVFLAKGIIAIGWPEVGDLSGRDKGGMVSVLCDTYPHYGVHTKTELTVDAGILDRFVNQIAPGHLVVVPNDGVIYAGEVTEGYSFHPELNGGGPDSGYPHWHSVRYFNGNEPYYSIKALPVGIRRAMDCHLTVFTINKGVQAMLDLIQAQGRA
jgi:restriction system protein